MAAPFPAPLAHWEATLEPRLWPTPLGPPLGPMPGHLSARARLGALIEASSAAAQTCCNKGFCGLRNSIVGIDGASRVVVVLPMVRLSGWLAASWLG